MTNISQKESSEYWKQYMNESYGKELIEFWNSVGEETWITSGGNKIHLDIYPQPKAANWSLVFSHGLAGYGRLLLPFIKPLYDRGFTIIAPDLLGYGHNPGKRGKFTYAQHVGNLVDTMDYAKENFDGKLLAGGGSMGGPLAYHASTQFKNIDGLICWCLFDFQDPVFIREVATFGRWAPFVLKLLGAFQWLIGNLRINMELVVPYSGLSTTEIVKKIRKDPFSGTKITVKGARSLLTESKPNITYENWKVPTLVIQPGADTMTPAKFTEEVYNKLGSSNKRYVEVEGAPHFPVLKTHYNHWTSEVLTFVKNLSR